MSKQRVLITGGAGFLGSHLSDRFIAEAGKLSQWIIFQLDQSTTFHIY